MRSGLFAVLAERDWKPNLLVPVVQSSNLRGAFFPSNILLLRMPDSPATLSQNGDAEMRLVTAGGLKRSVSST